MAIGAEEGQKGDGGMTQALFNWIGRSQRCNVTHRFSNSLFTLDLNNTKLSVSGLVLA